MGLGLAFKLFWKGLTDAAFATRVQTLMPAQPPVTPPVTPIAPKTAARSEALTLLAALQQEGRLVDFLKEPITAYNDAQIGAAVRDIHRDCGAVLERVFDIQPLLAQPDGAAVEVPAGFDAARYRLTGNVAGTAPFQGHLRHGGWVAAKVQLPEWNGSPAAANVVAPAEVEL